MANAYYSAKPLGEPHEHDIVDAKLVAPERAVIALAGDFGLQFRGACGTQVTIPAALTHAVRTALERGAPALIEVLASDFPGV